MTEITEAIAAALADGAGVEARTAGARACEEMIERVRRETRRRSEAAELREAAEILCVVLAAVRVQLLTDVVQAFGRGDGS